MPVVRQDLPTSGEAFVVSSAVFKTNPSIPPNCGIFWSDVGTKYVQPWAFGGTKYIRLATSSSLNSLADDVDILEEKSIQEKQEHEATREALQQLKSRLEALEALTGSLSSAVSSATMTMEETIRRELGAVKDAMHQDMQVIREQLSLQRRETLEGLEKEKRERDALISSVDDHCAEHAVVLESFHKSLRAQHAAVHTGLSQCLRPGCGKPSWNGKADGWCRTACRDISAEESTEFLKQAFANFTEHVCRLDMSVKRLDKKPSFFTTYKTVPTPLVKEEVFLAVDSFLQEWSRQRAISEPERNDFFVLLKAQAQDEHAEARARDHGLTEVQYVGARLWTSDHRLRGVALCNMICHANRDDSTGLLANGGVAIQKALNAALTFERIGQPLQRLQPPQHWNFQTHRGSKICSSGVQFFRDLLAEPPGPMRGMYRAPAPLASSLAKRVAENFLAMDPVHAGPTPVGGLVPVHFVFKWENEDGSHNDPPCVHARYIDGVSALRGEEEMLLAAYSVLVVCEIKEAIPAEGKPMEIVIRVCEDNRSWPEYLPLAKWH